MELVFTKKDENGAISAAEYGGKDLSVGGETYNVRKEGSRSLVNVPAPEAHKLIALGWMATGVATEAIVETAAQEALKRNAEEATAAKKSVSKEQPKA